MRLKGPLAAGGAEAAATVVAVEGVHHRPLDPRHRLEFLELLTRVHRERETTVVLVTHEIDLASDLADRVVLLRRGKALAAGAPVEILSPDLLRRAFGVESRIETGPDGKRRIVPYAPTRL